MTVGIPSQTPMAAVAGSAIGPSCDPKAIEHAPDASESRAARQRRV
jgi:hypothetical protein